MDGSIRIRRMRSEPLSEYFHGLVREVGSAAFVHALPLQLVHLCWSTEKMHRSSDLFMFAFCTSHSHLQGCSHLLPIFALDGVLEILDFLREMCTFQQGFCCRQPFQLQDRAFVSVKKKPVSFILSVSFKTHLFHTLPKSAEECGKTSQLFAGLQHSQSISCGRHDTLLLEKANKHERRLCSRLHGY